MSIAKVTEINASSTKSFEDAIQQGIARTAKTVRGIKGVWVQELKAAVENDKITEYRVNMRITFVVEA